MRRQLRPFYSDDELADVYPKMYDHSKWDDHKLRVSRTIDIVASWGRSQHWYDGIDLSCGDGAILKGLQSAGIVERAYFGDLVFADHLDVIGKIEDTLPLHVKVNLPDKDLRWDLFICSETLEHVVDPDKLLSEARRLAKNAVFTTPIDEGPEHGNPEHYWSWGINDIKQMLEAANWNPVSVITLPLPYYQFQVWCCS